MSQMATMESTELGTRLSAGHPRRRWRGSPPDTRFVWDLRCRWLKLGVGGRYADGNRWRCLRIMRGQNWQNTVLLLGSSMVRNNDRKEYELMHFKFVGTNSALDVNLVKQFRLQCGIDGRVGHW